MFGDGTSRLTPHCLTNSFPLCLPIRPVASAPVHFAPNASQQLCSAEGRMTEKYLGVHKLSAGR